MLKILRYRLYLLDPASVTTPDEDTLLQRDVVLMPADRMRAERESTKLLAPSQRNRKANPETWMVLWLWCAASRLGITTGTFDDFAAELVDYDELGRDGNPIADDADPDERDEARDDVDPTAADPSTT